MAAVNMVKKRLEGAVMYRSVLSTSPRSESTAAWGISNFSKLKDGTVYKRAENEGRLNLELLKKRQTVAVTFHTKMPLQNFYCVIYYTDGTISKTKVKDITETSQGVFEAKFRLPDYGKLPCTDEIHLRLFSREPNKTCEASTIKPYEPDEFGIRVKLAALFYKHDPNDLVTGFEDFDIHGNGFMMAVSKCVVAARSTYFREYFQTHPDDTSMYLDIKSKVFKSVLFYIYHGFLILDCPFWFSLELFDWAVRLGVKSLRRSLLHYLIRNTSKDNALDVKEMGIKTGHEELVEIADAFLAL